MTLLEMCLQCEEMGVAVRISSSLGGWRVQLLSRGNHEVLSFGNEPEVEKAFEVAAKKLRNKR